MKLKNGLLLFFLLVECVCFNVESKCLKGCDLALASYYVMPMTFQKNITRFMQSKIVFNSDVITSYNKAKVFNDNLLSFLRLNIPFPCDCIGGEFLGHVFEYSAEAGDTYDLIAKVKYANLTSVELLQRFNSYDPDNIPTNAKINVTVNCFCGNSQISKDYGLFITYPLRVGDTLQVIANQTNLDAQLLQSYNPGVNFSKESGIVFIPGRDQNGDYVPLYSRTAGLDTRVFAAAGISIGGACVLLLLTICIYVRYFQKKKEGEESKLPPEDSMESSIQYVSPAARGGNGIKFITIFKSPEFSYEELANATNNFSLANRIGRGGFGEVYYAELRGEKAAIKKMKMQASRQFLAELKVLTGVHHLNLVRLIGYCVEGSLFLVYEYMDNGNLSHHLRDTNREPLPWSTRVRIALDVARGLEYIHDHSVPVYIHRDIKSENILLNKNFSGKVADFGLTKLTDVASSSDNTDHVAGTFGYMPPENAYGRVSRKMDVYAFGVVLYELISAKEAVINIDEPNTKFKSLQFKTNESGPEFKSLVALFDEVIDHEGDLTKGLRKLVDPRLGDNYSIDSICKMAQLAKACTDRDPKRRPTMRSVVVALMTLNSTIHDRMCSAEINSSRTKALSSIMQHE